MARKHTLDIYECDGTARCVGCINDEAEEAEGSEVVDSGPSAAEVAYASLSDGDYEAEPGKLLTNARFEPGEFKDGQDVKLRADLQSIAPGTDATFRLTVLDMRGGTRDTTVLTASTEGDTVQADWHFEFPRPSGAIPAPEDIPSELAARARFRVEADGLTAPAEAVEILGPAVVAMRWERERVYRGASAAAVVETAAIPSGSALWYQLWEDGGRRAVFPAAAGEWEHSESSGDETRLELDLALVHGRTRREEQDPLKTHPVWVVVYFPDFGIGGCSPQLYVDFVDLALG